MSNQLMSLESFCQFCWGAEWGRKTKRKESLPRERLHQLGWREGTRTAVNSVHVEEVRGMSLMPKEKVSMILIITATHSALTGHYTTRLEPSLQACHPVFINRDCRVIQGCPAVRSCAGPQIQGCWSPEFMLVLFCVLYTYYRGESWTIKNVEHRRIDALKLWCWRRFLKVPWTSGDQAVNPKGNQP